MSRPNIALAAAGLALMVGLTVADGRSCLPSADHGADPSARNSKGETPGQVTFDAQLRSALGGSARASSPTSSSCVRMHHEATRLCDTGGSGSFCRTQAANRAQACNKTGRW